LLPEAPAPEGIALLSGAQQIFGSIRDQQLYRKARVLRAMPVRQRETLIRFYLNGESEEEIRAAMGMTNNQFRLIKSRAKSKYAELVRQSMNRVPSRKPVVATSARVYPRQATA
jgi:DNA-directed RNA polymerase specialized sigma24 family protein